MAQLRLTAADPVEAARLILREAGRHVVAEKALPYGRQLKVSGGMVNVYRSTGAVVPQGKDADELRRLFGLHIGNEMRVANGLEPLAALPVARAAKPDAAGPGVDTAAPYDGPCPFDL